MDGLRGFAILIVLLYHIYEKTHFAFDANIFGRVVDAHTFIKAGYLGVELFFFVSGFCLMLPYASWMAGHRSEQSWGEYASRRFWKIVPSYYLALAFVTVFIPDSPDLHVARTLNVALHAFFLHGFNADAFASLNGNFWSLAVEVEFYLIFPLLVWGFVRRPILTTVIVTLLGLLYSQTIAQNTMEGHFEWAYQLPSFLPLFAIGAFCAWVHERWIRGAVIARVMQIECGIAAVASVAALGYVFEQLNRRGGGPAAWGWENGHRFEIALILGIFTLTAACSTPFFQRCIANPLLAFLSDISYNMYLWNSPIINWLGYNWLSPWLRPSIRFAFFAFAITITVGWVLTRAFERPLMRYRFGTPQALWNGALRRLRPSTNSSP